MYPKTKSETSAEEMLLGMLFTKASYVQVMSLADQVQFLSQPNSSNVMGNFARSCRYLGNYLDAFDTLIETHAQTIVIQQLEAYVKYKRTKHAKIVMPAVRPAEWQECREKIVRYARGDQLVVNAQTKPLEVHLRALGYNVDTVAYRVAMLAVQRMRSEMNVDQRRKLVPIVSFMESLQVITAVPPVLPPAN